MKNATLMEHLRSTAEAAKNFTGGLVAEVLQAVTEAQREIAEVKADKPTATAVTLHVDGWTSIEGELPEDEALEDVAYPWRFDIHVEGLEVQDRADVTVAAGSAAAAASCGLCPTTETLAGTIRLRAYRKPEEPIEAEYWICTGKE